MAKILTPDERDRIVELRLNRVPVRAIAAEVGCTTKTVMTWWKRWLAETAAERTKHLEAARTEAVARLDKVAADSRLGVLKARRDSDATAEARFLTVEQNAILAAAKLSGLYVERIEQTGGFTVIKIVEDNTEEVL